LGTFTTSAAGRDILYIAHERSVNALALPHIQHASPGARSG